MPGEATNGRKGAVVVVRGPERDQCAELPILADGGPLCVAPVFCWAESRRYEGLYFIYQKVCGVRIGPYYPHIPFAVKGMKRALGLGKHLWENGLSWYGENRWVGAWVSQHLGGPNELSGGRWVDPDGRTITPEEFAARRG